MASYVVQIVKIKRILQRKIYHTLSYHSHCVDGGCMLEEQSATIWRTIFGASNPHHHHLLVGHPHLRNVLFRTYPSTFKKRKCINIKKASLSENLKLF